MGDPLRLSLRPLRIKPRIVPRKQRMEHVKKTDDFLYVSYSGYRFFPFLLR